MNILITGGLGYLGSVLIPKLLNKKFKIICVDKFMFGNAHALPFLLDDNFSLIKGDITNSDFMKNVFEHNNIDLIIHLAAYVGYPICKKFPKEAEETNLKGTHIINELRRDIPIIFGSTGSNYGHMEDDEVCTELTPLNPITLYCITKTKAENEIVQYGNHICFRFATAFGVSPRHRLDLLINDFCYKAQINKNLIVYERHYKRTFIHVEDIAKAFIFAIDNYHLTKNNIFNAGSNSLNYTKEQIVKKLQEYLDFYVHYAEIAKDEDQRNYMVDYSKITNLGFNIDWDLDKGIKQLIKVNKILELKSKFSNV